MKEIWGLWEGLSGATNKWVSSNFEKVVVNMDSKLQLVEKWLGG